MMDPNRLKVLEMVEEGKITVDEAERLLDKLKLSLSAGAPRHPFGDEPGRGSQVNPAPPSASLGAPPRLPRYLRVVVNSHDGDNVNVRVPMALVRTGLALSALLPEEARLKLEQKGVDLNNMKGLKPDELVAAMAELSVDVDSGDGDKVRVFCE